MGVQCPIVIATGHYLQTEVEAEARLLGAADFLHKPLLDLEHVARVLRNASAGAGRHHAPLSEPIYGITAASQSTRDVIAWLERIGPSGISVLLTGETGTGKELVARAIHSASRRRGRFMAINCGAIPESLFESVLFGHTAGAFTGATTAKAGLIEEAHDGTLFLDEIGDLPLQLQVALLRVLETREVWRVGETRPRPAHVRVIAATNRVLKDEIAQGRFRLDLYFRLAGAVRQLLPLRERPEDIDALIHYWLTREVNHHNGTAISISPGALKILRAQVWPGNARELRNVLDRALCLLDGTLLTEREIAVALSPETPSKLPSDPHNSKRARAEAALRAAGGNPRRASSHLGINKATLYRWLKLDQGATSPARESR
jgi:transcriptional regulator with PAS, ATPase and Fis domain